MLYFYSIIFVFLYKSFLWQSNFLCPTTIINNPYNLEVRFESWNLRESRSRQLEWSLSKAMLYY